MLRSIVNRIRKRENESFIHIPKHKFPFFQDSLFYANKLERKFPGCFKVIDDRILFSSNEFKVYVYTREELFILTEILVSSSYDFDYNGPISVIDIGMNVGFASLFFASKSNVRKVVGFEPFEPTYKASLENFDLNPGLKLKIVPNQFGLGGQEKQLNTLYSYRYKGNVGVHGLTESLVAPDETNENIEIRNASAVLRPLFDDGTKYFLKVDCEGSEYEIIPDLDQSGLIERFDFIFLEWHKGEVNILKNILLKNHFFLISERINDDYGLIYAVKNV